MGCEEQDGEGCGPKQLRNNNLGRDLQNFQGFRQSEKYGSTVKNIKCCNIRSTMILRKLKVNNGKEQNIENSEFILKLKFLLER